jgi:NAD(P)-dependent dehydrogenase (short-subunit alcohol dehydrogenase family)
VINEQGRQTERKKAARSYCDTHAYQADWQGALLSESAFDSLDPDDIGGVIAFLASEDARWITGDTIRVDGGSKL